MLCQRTRFALFICAVFLNAAPLLAAPSIVWTPARIERLVYPGAHLHESITISSSTTLNGVTLNIVRAISPYISVSPTFFPQIVAGQTYPVELDISIPITAPTNVVYDGTIQLRTGKSTVPATLKIVLDSEVAAAQIPQQSALVQDETGLIFPVNEIIIGLAGGSTADDAASIARSVNGSIVGYVPSTQSYQLRLQTTSIPELDLVAATLKSDGRVVEVLRNYAASLFGTTTDLKNLQGCLPTAAAAYDRVLLQNAWDIIPLSRVTTSQLLIGVLDTGINRAHQEFNNPFVDTGPETPDPDPVI